MKILFVCTANVSRSYLAEMLLEHETRSLGLGGIEVGSAGLSAYPGSPPDSKMSAYLLEMGAAIKPHESRQISKADVEWADRIIVMEKRHAEEIRGAWPEAADKVALMGQFISRERVADDIIDPFGRSSYHYRLAQSQITLAVKNLANTLLAES